MAPHSSCWIACLRDSRYIDGVALAKDGRIVLIGASIIVIGAGIKLAAPLLVPVLVAAFIAIVTAPLVIWLCDRGVPRLLAVLSGLLLDVAAGAALGFPLAAAVATFTERVPEYASMLSGQMERLELWLAGYGIHLESVYDFSEPTWMLNLATTMAQSAASFVSQMVLVLLIVAFMLFESTGLREKLSKIATPNQIEDLSSAAHEVNTYLVAKTVMSLLTGVLVFIWCWWRGVDVPLLWGLLAYLLNYIPNRRSDHRSGSGNHARPDSARPWAGAGARSWVRGDQSRHRRGRATRDGSSAGAICTGRARVHGRLGMAIGTGRRAGLGAAHDGHQALPRAQRRPPMAGGPPRPFAQTCRQARRRQPRIRGRAQSRVSASPARSAKRRRTCSAAALGVARPWPTASSSCLISAESSGSLRSARRSPSSTISHIH